MFQKPFFSGKEAYLENEKKYYPSYYREIERASRQIGGIGKDPEIVVAVPVHTIEPSIKDLLRCYQHQDYDRAKYRIILFINGNSKNSDCSHLLREVDYAKNLGLPVTVLKKTFEKKITMGYIRKFLCDSILLRFRDSNLIIVNNDADLEELESVYLREVSTAASNKTKKIFYRLVSFSRQYAQYPCFCMLTTLNRDFDEEYNRLNDDRLPIRVHNYNLIFSADTYAHLGGYCASVDVGEDLTLAYYASNIFSKSCFLRLQSHIIPSARRYVFAYVNDIPIYRAWDDFENLKVRTIREAQQHELLSHKEKRVSNQYFEHEVLEFYSHVLDRRFKPYISDHFEATRLCDKVFSAIISRKTKLTPSRHLSRTWSDR